VKEEGGSCTTRTMEQVSTDFYIELCSAKFILPHVKQFSVFNNVNNLPNQRNRLQTQLTLVESYRWQRSITVRVSIDTVLILKVATFITFNLILLWIANLIRRVERFGLHLRAVNKIKSLFIPDTHRLGKYIFTYRDAA
jgi:hypothetical protein